MKGYCLATLCRFDENLEIRAPWVRVMRLLNGETHLAATFAEIVRYPSLGPVGNS